MRTHTDSLSFSGAGSLGDAVAQTRLSRPRLVAERRERLRRAFDDLAADALVLTSPEAVDYATGYRSVFGAMRPDYALAAVVTKDDVRLLCPAADALAAIDAGVPADAVTPHGTYFVSGTGGLGMPPARADLAAALADSLRTDRHPRIAAEGWLMRSGWASAHAAADASEWMLRLRASKTAGEQTRLRVSAQVAEASIEDALALAGVGVSEIDLAQAVRQSMTANGADARYVTVTAGRRSAYGDAAATDATLAPGDLLRFDLGCVVDGYWSDIARTAVVGEPTRMQQERYDALLAGTVAAIDDIRPGMTPRDLFARTVATVESGGLSPYRRHHVGHAIGLSVYEWPVVAPDADRPIPRDGVFCLETPFYELGWGGMMVEEAGLVTDNGFELFTGSDRSLRVVEA